MKKIIIYIISFILSSQLAFALSGDEQRREELLSIINEELKEVTRINEQVNGRDPNLMLRMAELLLEKARLIKYDENQRFLALPPEKRRNINKKQFFNRSFQYFSQAQKTCIVILKKFKKFKGIGEVYYILAYNAKEFQQESKARSYFQRAVKYSSKESYANKKSKLALGEIHFNKSEYSKAIPLYEQALVGQKDKWWTKDAYNLAWSYYRVGKKSKAISLMRDVHKYSKDPKFVDMGHSVERDLAYFYTDSGKASQAIDFYKSIGGNVVDNLIKVSDYLINQGKFTSAEKTLAAVKKHNLTERQNVEVNIKLLNLYERFGKVEKHLAVSNELFQQFSKGNLKNEEVENLKYHVQKMSALLQKQVASKRYQKQTKVLNKKAEMAVEYFKISAHVNTKSSHRNYFHAAETFYAANLFNEAVAMYDQAYQLSVKNGDQKIQDLALDGMMASLAGKGVTKKTKDEYLIPTFVRFINKNPKGKKSFKIYQRLFNAYYDKKDIQNCERVLYAFKKVYPESYSTQEAMLAKIMDYHKDRNDEKAIAEWVNRINRGDFKVSADYARKVRLLLLTMQFKDVEKANTTGDKKKALKGYVEIYKDTLSTPTAKKNAAYNIAVLFHELGDTRRTYGWAERSLELMSSSDVKKFEESFMAMASELFNQRKFADSADLYDDVFTKLCSEKSRNKKSYFKNANFIYLADGHVSESKKLIDKAEKCGIPNKYIQEARIELLKHLYRLKRFSEYEQEIVSYDKYKALWPNLIEHLGNVRVHYVNLAQTKKAEEIEAQILRYYSYSKRTKQDVSLDGLNVVAQLKLDSLVRSYESLKSIKLSFPEEIFNKQLKSKFSQLDKITAESLQVLEIGSGSGIVAAYDVLIQSYEYLVTEINTFSPSDKSEDYLASFKKSMSNITAPIALKAEEFKKEVKRQIEKSQILSRDNYKHITEVNHPVRVEYYYVHGGIVMDKGGMR